MPRKTKLIFFLYLYSIAHHSCNYRYRSPSTNQPLDEWENVSSIIILSFLYERRNPNTVGNVIIPYVLCGRINLDEICSFLDNTLTMVYFTPSFSLFYFKFRQRRSNNLIVKMYHIYFDRSTLWVWYSTKNLQFPYKKLSLEVDINNSMRKIEFSFEVWDTIETKYAIHIFLCLLVLSYRVPEYLYFFNVESYYCRIGALFIEAFGSKKRLTSPPKRVYESVPKCVTRTLTYEWPEHLPSGDRPLWVAWRPV